MTDDPTLTRPCGSATAGLIDKCENVVVGEAYECQRKWKEASAAYLNAITSKSAKLRTIAIERYRAVQSQAQIDNISLTHAYYAIGAFLGAMLLIQILINSLFKQKIAVQPPTDLTDTTKTNALFAAEMAAASADMGKRRLPAEGLRHQSGGSGALTAPTSLLGTVSKSLPKIEGIDVSGWVTALANLVAYFSWRFDSAVEVSSTASVQGGGVSTQSGASTQVVAFGTRSWAWRVEPTWRVEGTGVQQAARRMAYLLMGARADEKRTLGFSSPKSFMWFAEGLRSLQIYQEKLSIENLKDAEQFFTNSIVLAPEDALPRYYAGVVQIEIAAVLPQITGSDPLRSRVLDNAIANLEYVTKGDKLLEFSAAATYNCATANLYRITEAGYRKCRDLLDSMKDDLESWASWNTKSVFYRQIQHRGDFEGEVPTADSVKALRFQIESLYLLSRARPLWDGVLPHKESLDAVARDVETFNRSLDSESKHVSDRAMLDLKSDYYYLRGHVARGRATQSGDDIPKFLQDAAEEFRTALSYQPNWIPALVNLKQVYTMLYKRDAATWKSEYDLATSRVPVWPSQPNVTTS